MLQMIKTGKKDRMCLFPDCISDDLPKAVGNKLERWLQPGPDSASRLIYGILTAHESWLSYEATRPLLQTARFQQTPETPDFWGSPLWNHWKTVSITFFPPSSLGPSRQKTMKRKPHEIEGNRQESVKPDSLSFRKGNPYSANLFYFTPISLKIRMR